MALPEDKSEVKTKPEEYIWWIYGDPKIGKSTFCSQFEDVLIVDTQKGYKHLSVHKYEIHDWVGFTNAVKDIKEASEAGTLKFKVVALDLIDDLYQYCYNHIVQQHGSGWYPGDEGYGKGWKEISQEFIRVLHILSKYITPVFVSHAEDKMIKTQSIESTKTVPSIIGNKVGKFINSIVDIIAYVTTDKDNNQVVVTRGHSGLIAGCKYPILPPEMPLDYKEMKDVFNSKENK